MSNSGFRSGNPDYLKQSPTNESSVGSTEESKEHRCTEHHACMFFSVETLVSCIKEIFWEDREDVEKYIQNKRIAQELELDYTFSAPIAEGITMGTDWNVMHPASAVRLVICKDNYTSFRIVTAYPYPSFDEMDQWYDAVDQGF